MATIKGEPTPLNDDSVRVVWASVTNADTCEAIGGLSEYDDRSVQMSGNFDGGSIDIKGSNDDNNFEALSDPTGTPLSFATAKIRAILEYVHQLKPVPSGGGGSMSVTITLLAKRKRR